MVGHIFLVQRETNALRYRLSKDRVIVVSYKILGAQHLRIFTLSKDRASTHKRC